MPGGVGGVHSESTGLLHTLSLLGYVDNGILGE